MPNAKAIIADEMKTYMIQGEANIAVTFSGEASKMLSENEDLAYVVPSEERTYGLIISSFQNGW